MWQKRRHRWHLFSHLWHLFDHSGGWKVCGNFISLWQSHLHNVDVLPSHAFANLNVGLAIRKLLGDHIGVVDPQPGWVGAWFIWTSMLDDNPNDININEEKWNLSQILWARSGWEEPENTYDNQIQLFLVIKLKTPWWWSNWNVYNRKMAIIDSIRGNQS